MVQGPAPTRRLAFAIALVLTAINFVNYLDRQVVFAVLEPMRLELGALTEEEFAALEAELTGRLRAIRERERTAVEGASVAGVEVSVHDDEHA